VSLNVKGKHSRSWFDVATEPTVGYH